MFKKGHKPVRKTGTSAVKRERKPIITWKAPDDFKPFFCQILVRTDKDGLLSPDIKVTRFQGRYSIEADERKRFLMNEYDPRTVQGILARLSMATMATSKRRLPANKTWHIVIRVGIKKATGDVNVLFKEVGIIKKFKSGKTKLELFDKKDPEYKKFRKANRLLGSAFSLALMPPKRTRGSRKAEE